MVRISADKGAIQLRGIDMKKTKVPANHGTFVTGDHPSDGAGLKPIDKPADVQDNAQSVVKIIDDEVVSRDAIQLARKLSVQ